MGSKHFSAFVPIVVVDRADICQQTIRNPSSSESDASVNRQSQSGVMGKGISVCTLCYHFLRFVWVGKLRNAFYGVFFNWEIWLNLPSNAFVQIPHNSPRLFPRRVYSSFDNICPRQTPSLIAQPPNCRKRKWKRPFLLSRTRKPSVSRNVVARLVLCLGFRFRFRWWFDSQVALFDLVHRVGSSPCSCSWSNYSRHVFLFLFTTVLAVVLSCGRFALA